MALRASHYFLAKTACHIVGAARPRRKKIQKRARGRGRVAPLSAQAFASSVIGKCLAILQVSRKHALSNSRGVPAIRPQAMYSEFSLAENLIGVCIRLRLKL